MKNRSTNLMSFVVSSLLVLFSPTFARAATSGLDQEGIIQAFGRSGQVLGENAYKVSFPRSDLHVTAEGVAIKPALSLTAWAAFKKSGDMAICYGDLVLLEDEINPVISKLEEKGIGISALHNHLLHETPRVMYVHFMGQGNEVDMAKALREALALTKTPMTPSKPSAPEEKSDVAKEIEKVLGYEGKMSGGVLQVPVPRNDIHIKMMGMDIPGNMGMNTPLNFQIDGKQAAINGDFMLLANEIDPVIKVLRENHIEVASLHNHLLDEEPYPFFMHFWAHGDAITLAKGLKAALDTQKK